MLLFYTSSTLGSGTVWAARVRPSLSFINHTTTVNGRIILLLVVDWELSPVTVCMCETVRECECVYLYVNMCLHDCAQVGMCVSISSHQVLVYMCSWPAMHATHCIRTLTHSRCSLTPWRLGLPVMLELGCALPDRLFPLRALWLQRDHVPIHQCLFSMSLWVQHSFTDRLHRNSLLC